jgi:hypothetical protein
LLLTTRKTIATLVFVLAALPASAAHIDSVDWDTPRSVAIGTTQIQPGKYQLKAEEGKSELTIMSKGKIIATIPCHWMELPTKADTSSVATDGDKVTQVEFGGRTSAIQFTQ